MQRLLLRSERGLSRSVLLARLPLLVFAAAAAATTATAAAAAAAAAAASGLPQRPRRPHGLQPSRAGGGDLTLSRLRAPQRVRVAQRLRLLLSLREAGVGVAQELLLPLGCVVRQLVAACGGRHRRGDGQRGGGG